MGVQNAKASASCATVSPKGNLVESPGTPYVAIKYDALLFVYAALGDKFIPLPTYHSCGDV